MPQNGIIGGVVGWLKHPFDSEGTAFNYLLFVGLIVIAVWFWQTVLLNITTE